MKKQFIFLTLLSLILVGIAMAGSITLPGPNNAFAPTDGTVLTSTSVNFSFMVNNTVSGVNATQFEVTVYNNSDRTQVLNNTNWGELFKANISNATLFNRTVTMTDGLRHYWKIQVTNRTGESYNGSFTPTNSSRFTFNVDVNYYRLVFGSQNNINFSLDTGDINSSGKAYFAKNVTFQAPDGTKFSCGVNATGQFGCDPE